MTPMLELTDAGLYCAAGDFHIDPWQPVARALITHAHGDHARGGSAAYLAAAPGLAAAARAPADPTRRIETLRVRRAPPRSAASTCPSIRPATCSAARRSASRSAAGVDRRVGRLQARARSDVRAVRARALRRCSSPSRRSACRSIRWDRAATSRCARSPRWWDGQPRRRRGERAVRVRARQGAADPRRARRARRRRSARTALHARRRRAGQRRVSRGRAWRCRPRCRVAAAAPDTRWSEALIVAPPSAQGSALDAPLRRRSGPHSPRAGWPSAAPAGAQASTAASSLSDHADWPALNEAIAATGAAQRPGDARLQRRAGAVAARDGRPGGPLDTRFEGEAGADARRSRGADGGSAAACPRPGGGMPGRT